MKLKIELFNEAANNLLRSRDASTQTGACTIAKRIAEKLEIHYTPKHGSWLNMAEIEIGVMGRQCLYEYTPLKNPRPQRLSLK